VISDWTGDAARELVFSTKDVMFSDYQLSELLSSAGATVGVIIGGTIFLQFLSSKYVELSGRYRSLTAEYRGQKGESRHDMLQQQIRAYRCRLWLLTRASTVAAVALFCFLLAILSGGMSMVLGTGKVLRPTGTIALFLGFVLIGVAVLMEPAESILSASEIGEEAGDLDDPVKKHTAGTNP